jgi:TIR domain
MAHDVFISHAYKDKGIADAICGKLESANVRCWIAPRNISAGEDWTKAIRHAISSTRVVILVFSENSNAAPHMGREIANAFYAGRIIIPFRLGNAHPRRDFLFYLGNARWFESVDPPAEQNLEALTACIKGMLVGGAAPCSDVSLQGAMKKTANLLKSSPDTQIPTKLKRVGTTVSIVAVVLLLWLASEQVKQNVTPDRTSSQSMYYGAKASGAQPKEDASASTPRYTLSRLGLWVPVNPSPTPAVEAGPQETPSANSKASSENATPLPSSVDPNAGGEGESGPVHGSAMAESTRNNPPRTANRRERHRGRLRPKSERSRFAYIRGWLTAIWRKSVGRIREAGD